MKELRNCFEQLKTFEDQILDTSDCYGELDDHNFSGEQLKDSVSKKLRALLDVARVSMCLHLVKL
jgi:hypothetical protein